MAELYRLDFASGKSYIGVTRHTATFRFKGHEAAARNSAKGIVYGAWRKYGAPKMVRLAILETDDMLDAEKRAIVAFGTRHPYGYNLTDGGDGAPSLSPEVAAKIADKLRGRRMSPERLATHAAAMTGRKHSEASKARMSAAQKGRTFSAEHLEKLAAAKRGTKRSISVRAKMSEAQQARRMREGCIPNRKQYPGVFG